MGNCRTGFNKCVTSNVEGAHLIHGSANAFYRNNTHFQVGQRA